MSKERRIPREDPDFQTFHVLKRKLGAYKRQGINPTEEMITKLVGLDEQLALKYSAWDRHFPAKK